MIARRILVRGKVQGVFYRNWTMVTARSLRLNGWVRNLSSGEVEILAIGEAEAIEDLIGQCWQGPFGAVVEEVVAEKAPLEPVLGFEKRRTA
jgi:acylphosphatase